MTTPMERRLRKLEEYVPGSSDTKPMRIVVVHAGQSAEAERAKRTDIEPDDEVCFVHLVRNDHVSEAVH